jgi:hypothetical protein
MSYSSTTRRTEALTVSGRRLTTCGLRRQAPRSCPGRPARPPGNLAATPGCTPARVGPVRSRRRNARSPRAAALRRARPRCGCTSSAAPGPAAACSRWWRGVAVDIDDPRARRRLLGDLAHVRLHRDERTRRVLAGEEVVAAAEPVVVDPGNIGLPRVYARRYPAQLIRQRLSNTTQSRGYAAVPQPAASCSRSGLCRQISA